MIQIGGKPKASKHSQLVNDNMYRNQIIKGISLKKVRSYISEAAGRDIVDCGEPN